MSRVKRLATELSIPKHAKRPPQPVYISSNSRQMPVFMGAGSGTGKSRLLGRLVGWQDL